MVRSLLLANHAAHLNLETGDGVLVLPRSEDDVWLGAESIHGADWDHVVRLLHAMSWEPSEDEIDGGLLSMGMDHEGREVIGLYGRNPLRDEPSIAERANALSGLLALAGVEQ